MMYCTLRCLNGIRTRATANRRLRLLLVLGLMAWAGMTSLHAQTPQAPTQPPNAVPAPPPVAPSPPSPTPRSQPDQPLTSNPPQTIDLSQQLILSGEAIPSRRFQFNIDPKTPLKDLLPAPPRIGKTTGPMLSDDLGRVPEVRFQASEAKEIPSVEALKQIAHQIAKINHLNGKKTDGFLEALRDERPDLNGLPFAMGDACRTKGERSRQFALAVATVRRALQSPSPSAVTTVRRMLQSPSPKSDPMPAGERLPPLPPDTPTPTPPPAVTSGGAPSGSTITFSTVITSQASVNPPSPEAFWNQYQTLCTQEDKTRTQSERAQRETVVLARIAALTQILMPMTEMHPGLVKHLAAISHVEATRALARLAIFSSAEDARKAALDALKVRRERDYTEILVQGLRYPWPAVARRAAEAVAKLERNDLLPQLIGLLEEDDPRTPVMRTIKEKDVPVVRELVRVNHHRSCLLCHAPGNTGKVSSEAVTAEVPVPGQPLTPPSGGYNTSQPDILVRVDVTYLRQDFSAFQAVADANPWPEMQRFDFLVRSRVLSDEEAAAYRAKLKPREPGEFSPYQRAALAALRDLTGRDTEPTPQAWRRLLKLPKETQRNTRTP